MRFTVKGNEITLFEVKKITLETLKGDARSYLTIIIQDEEEETKIVCYGIANEKILVEQEI